MDFGPKCVYHLVMPKRSRRDGHAEMSGSDDCIMIIIIYVELKRPKSCPEANGIFQTVFTTTAAGRNRTHELLLLS